MRRTSISDSRPSDAFHTLDAELRPASLPRRGVAPWEAAKARRRRRTALGGGVTAACLAVATVGVTEGWGRTPGTSGGVSISAGAEPGSTPVPSPRTDQALFSAATDHPQANLATADAALAGHLLSPGALGWDVTATPVTSGRGLPGTPDAAKYAGANWSSLMSPKDSDGLAWEMEQTVVRMAPGAATAAYTTATTQLTCTTPDVGAATPAP